MEISHSLLYRIYMKDYMTIKEFSKLTGIEQTTLRYWDDIGLFSPTRRNPENNYRYYTPEQIIAVNFITVLSELSIPLKTISEMEEGRTPDKIIELIEHQEKVLDMEMRRLHENYSVIHARLELINYGKRLLEGYRVVNGEKISVDKALKEGELVNEEKISVLNRNMKNFILGPRNEWNPGDSFYEHFIGFCKSAKDLRINLSLPIGGYHTDFKSFSKAPGEPDYFFSLDPSGYETRKEGKYLVGFHKGYYGHFGDLPERMVAYIKEHKIRVKGPVYTLYLLDEVCMADPDEYLAQISVAIS